MPYGSPHTATIPVVGVTTGPTFAVQINAAIAEIRATVDAKVTPAGIDINADLSFLSGITRFAATDVERIAFDNKGAPIAAATFPTAVFVSGGDLFFNDASARQVQITAGGAVNVSTTGGITGAGYGTGGVELNYDSGTNSYRFRSGVGTDSFAAIECDDVILRDGSGNTCRFVAPAMAANYTLTVPAAVPGSTSLIQMDAAGALTASNALAVNQSITTSGTGGIVIGGTGDYKRGQKVSKLSLISGYQESGTNAVKQTSGGITNGRISFTTPTTGNDWVVPIPRLQEGERIISVRARVNENLSGGNQRITLQLRRSAATSSVLATQNTSGSGVQDITATLGAPETVSSSQGDFQYFIRFLVDGTTGVSELHDVDIVTDVP